jgi:hypothetical protein
MLRPLLMAATAAGLLSACATPQSQPDVAAKVVASTPPNCLTTGTRIALKPGECANAAGRVYSKDQLDQTGALTTAEALRRLDPSLTR